MKKTIYFFSATLFIGGTVFTACKSSTEKVETAEVRAADAKQDMEKAEMDFTAAKLEFRNEMDAKITANEKTISELKEKPKNESKTDKAARKLKIAEIEQKNTDMKKRMDEYKENGKEGWESFKREFNHDMDELGDALNDLTVNNSK